MAEMIPVGNTGTPPLQSLSSLINAQSGLIGLQQQKQALQTGQYTQATAQAESQQAQQKNSELQALARFTSTAAKDPSYELPDGTPDIGKYQRGAMTVAPTYGQEYIGHMSSNFKEAVETRRSLQNLSKEQNEQLANGLKGLANIPGGATKTDVTNWIEQQRSNNKDPGFNRALTNMSLSLTPDSNGGYSSGAAKAAAVLGGISMQAPGEMDLGGKVQPGTTTTMGPNTGQFTPVGTAQKKILSPTVVTPPGGIPTVLGAGGAPSQQVGSSSPGPAPTNQDYENFGAYQANLNARVRQASDSIPRIQMAEQALDSIRTGGGTQARIDWAKKLQAVGAPKDFVDAVAGGNLGAAQEAEKLLFQTTFTGLRQSMQGDPARVAEFEAADKVFPNVGTDPRASKAILNFMVDQGKRDFAEQQALTKARKEGSFNPATWESDYQAQLRAGKVSGTPTTQVPTGEQRGTSKSGKPIVFRNGRWEYE